MSAAGQVAKTLFVRLRFIFVFVAIGVIVGKWDWIMAVATKAIGHREIVAPPGDFEWFCPMHPTIVRNDAKEKCPVCFMPLSKRKRGEKVELPAGVVARVTLTGTRVRQAGVGTEEIGYRNMVRELRTIGTIEWDERKYAHLSARIAGRADELFINFTGVRVKKGDPVYRLYSPDLVTTQEEYLLALKALEELKDAGDAAVARARRLADSTRERLKLWGIAEEQLAELEKSSKAQTHLTILSPVGGIVIKKDIYAGHLVVVGEDPYTLVDDSTVWMQAEVFERDLGLLKVGQQVEITAEAYPGTPFTGRVIFIAPEVQSDTRTVKARVDVDNKDGRLKAGMTVGAVLRVPLGKAGEVYYGCCEACPEIREEVPGKCKKCAMELVKKGGVHGEEKKAAAAEPKKKDAPETRTVYVCDLHPEEVFDKPGQCFKGSCNGMVLEARKIVPGARLIYVCPDHPEVVSDKPGICPKDQKKLQYRIVSDTKQLAESWACPMHPERTAGGKLTCPECGTAMKHVESEELLAVPASAVVDTGVRKIVFLDKGHDTFDAVEVEIGPRAGEYYPILKGLAAGDRVVSAGAFLLDAEARLNPAAGVMYFGASGGEKK